MVGLSGGWRPHNDMYGTRHAALITLKDLLRPSEVGLLVPSLRLDCVCGAEVQDDMPHVCCYLPSRFVSHR